MVYHFLLCLTTRIFDVFASIRLARDEKDLQIALLRQQLRVLEGKVKKKPRRSRPEKRMHVARTTRLQRQTQRWQRRLRETVLLVQPETVLKWHRELVRTPVRAPRANAVAERWVRSVRQECLDHLLILNQRHLIRVLKEYIDYYNVSRPHQGLDQQVPIPMPRSPQGVIRCGDVPAGILHDYYRDAA